MEHLYDLVVFDCDGTLTDTGVTHVRWCNDINAWLGCGLPTINVDEPSEIRKVLGNPMATVIREYGFPESTVPFLVQKYEETFSKDPSYASHPFQGIISLLAKLKSIGISTGIVSSNVLSNVRRDLGSGLDCITELVTKENLDREHWTKSEALRSLKKCFVSKNPIYVGDTSSDEAAAKRAEWPFIWVAYGWESPPEDYPSRVESVSELAKRLGV
jgi:phosphoglycolate phosphatase